MPDLTVPLDDAAWSVVRERNGLMSEEAAIEFVREDGNGTKIHEMLRGVIEIYDDTRKRLKDIKDTKDELSQTYKVTENGGEKDILRAEYAAQRAGALAAVMGLCLLDEMKNWRDICEVQRSELATMNSIAWSNQVEIHNQLSQIKLSAVYLRLEKEDHAETKSKLQELMREKLIPRSKFDVRKAADSDRTIHHQEVALEEAVAFMKAKDVEIQQLRIECERTRATISEYETKLGDQATDGSAKASARAKEAEIQELRKEYESAMETIEEQKTEIWGLDQTIRHQTKSLEGATNTVKLKVEQIEKLRATKRDLRAQLDQANHCLKQQEKDLQERDDNISTLEGVKIRMKSGYESNQAQLAACRGELRSIKQKLEDANQRIQVHVATIREKTQELESTMADVTSKQELLRSQESTIRDGENMIRFMEEERNAIMITSALAKSQFDQLQRDLSTRTVERDDVQGKLKHSLECANASRKSYESALEGFRKTGAQQNQRIRELEKTLADKTLKEAARASKKIQKTIPSKRFPLRPDVEVTSDAHTTDAERFLTGSNPDDSGSASESRSRMDQTYLMSQYAISPSLSHKK